MFVTGLKIWHVGERFQHANDTISKYYRHVLFIVSSQPFYTEYVKLPTSDDPIHPYISENPKFTSYFSGALRAIDGTHINCCPSAKERHGARDRK
ncbi:hypothetical protein EV121DRAFT_174678, partial [Schizophyllum commune]